MAQIDRFLEMMATGNFDRAVLVNDHNGQMWSGAKESPGPAIPLLQLQTIVQEVTPPAMRGQLNGDGELNFVHVSPKGPYSIGVEKNNGSLRVNIQAGGDAASDHGAEAAAKLSRPAESGGENAPASTRAASHGPSYAADDSTVEVNELTDGVVHGKGGTRRIQHIDELFRHIKDIEASDLHLSSNVMPMIRDQGIMKSLDEYEVNDPARLQELLFKIAPERNREEWEDVRDTDFAYEIPGVARFRCNFFADRHGIGAVFRLIPSDVLTVKQLGLPPVMTDLCKLSKGLVVVTGPTGSGKSTTLAALIDHINKTREDHIITIEDPVEFVHNNIKCLINQREVHVHNRQLQARPASRFAPKTRTSRWSAKCAIWKQSPSRLKPPKPAIWFSARCTPQPRRPRLTASSTSFPPTSRRRFASCYQSRSKA